MAKVKPDSLSLEFPEPPPVKVEVAHVTTQPEPKPEPPLPKVPTEYDLTDPATVHDLRKKGLLWRCKCESVPCWLTVCETEVQARCNFLGKFPDAKGKLKIEQLRP